MSDLESLVRHANNRNIWINLRDRFPHPYLEEHGKKFLEHITQQSPCTVWAIEVDGECAGGIGIERMTDVERVSCEIGYWLGEAYWNRGVVTDALKMVTAEVFRQLDVTRVFALPFADNIGSIRVLEKAGYVREGTLRDSALKDGQLRDQFLYATYRRAR
jgi:RimJ/RimL family protein N-acetyltransferase